ncbi:MAG: hypothetical protein ACJ8LM_16275 [Candidatus Udaeobacter sp.]
MSTTYMTAQDGSPGAAQRTEDLRAKLLDVQGKESELQMRVQQLDLDLRPENLERFFAATGSTRPEELREQRRRQLQLEKESVVAQLEQLAASRVRLESAILTADAEAYQQSAQGIATALVSKRLGSKEFANTLFFAGVLALVALAALSVLVALVLRRRRN